MAGTPAGHDSVGVTRRSVESAEPLQFVFYSEFLFFEGRDPGFIPIGVGQFSGDNFFEFTVLISQMIGLSF